MKKLLLTTLLSLGLFIPVNAFEVTMDYQTDTLIDQQTNVVERALLLNCSEDGRYDITIKPLEGYMVRTDGLVSIPVYNNVFINNTVEDVYMQELTESFLFQGTSFQGAAKNLTAKIKNYGMVPAGIYTLNFQIDAANLDTLETRTSTFNLQFNIPVAQSIDNRGQQAHIKLGAENAFDEVQKITNETSPMIYINSNADWELSLSTDSFVSDAGNYYVRVISASSDNIERLQERVYIMPNKEIILARGKAPTSNGYITVEYSLENKNNKIIRAGNYENKVRYILREKG